jgi:hypothetical protein
MSNLKQNKYQLISLLLLSLLGACAEEASVQVVESSTEKTSDNKTEYGNEHSNDIKHYLGRGINLVDHSVLTQKCLEDFDFFVMPNHKKNLVTEVFTSTKEVNEFFFKSLQANLAVSAYTVSTNAQYDTQKTQASQGKMSTIYVAIAADEMISEATMDGTPKLKDTMADLLSNTRDGTTEFRETCGDQGINRAFIGKSLHAVIQMTSTNTQQSKLEEFAYSLKAGFNQLNVSVDAELEQKTRKALQKAEETYHLELHVFSTGDSGFYPDMSVDNFIDKLKTFDDIKEGDGSVIGFVSAPYPNPTQKPAKEVFLDYKAVRKKLKAWRFYIDEYVQDPCRANSTLKTICQDIKATYQSQLETCRNADTWDDCFAPKVKGCQLLDSGQPCNQIQYLNKPKKVTVRLPDSCDYLVTVKTNHVYNAGTDGLVTISLIDSDTRIVMQEELKSTNNPFERGHTDYFELKRKKCRSLKDTKLQVNLVPRGDEWPWALDSIQVTNLTTHERKMFNYGSYWFNSASTLTVKR